MKKETILLTGANGQIGSVLTEALRKQYGQQQVIATDISEPTRQNEPFEQLNILHKDRLVELVKKYQVTQIYHLVAILSAKGEEKPKFAWDLNMNGLFNVLETARELGLNKVFFPSSIAVHGPNTPKQNTPQHTILEPSTVYGISKLAGEQWCAYYFKKYGLDVRSIRYPGIIGYQSLAGGGTTDYAVDIYHHAVAKQDFECFLKEDSRLPMLYMDDAIRATLELMNAPAEHIRIRTSYNISGMSFTPAEVTASIQELLPNFKVSYKPDSRQQIADSWSQSIDDSEAQADWGWKAQYDLKKMTREMLRQLKKKQTLIITS